MYNLSGDFMYSVDNIYINEYIINKSRFITYLIPVKSIDEVNNHINEIKNKYKDATHHCYAYIIDNVKRFNDDGEPGGTAGMPILNVIESNNLNYVLAVVVRYFGGIKLGAGGLVRAYSKSVSSSLIDDNITTLIDGYKVEIVVSYDEQKRLDYILKDYEYNKTFSDVVSYIINVPKDDMNILDNYKCNIICEIKIEKDAS